MMTQASGYVSIDYLKRAAELVKNVKQYSYKMMHADTGHQVLDVGCGPGVDTVALSKLVGYSGRVVGTDIDKSMLDAANKHAEEEGVSGNITHRVADVKELPFGDESFDACRAERLLQILPESYEPKRVVEEMVRVTKKGGNIVLIDTDWGSFSVDSSNGVIERQLTCFFSQQLRPNGFSGRQLYRLLKETKLIDIQIEVFPLIHWELANTPLKWIYDEAKTAELIPTTYLDAWYQEMERRDEEGLFFSTVNMVVAAGSKEKGI